MTYSIEATPFNKWLSKATDFDGFRGIADLAKDANVDPEWPDVTNLDDMLDYLPRVKSDVEQGLRRSMVYAWSEGVYALTGRNINAKRLNEVCQRMNDLASFENTDKPEFAEERKELEELRDSKQALLAGVVLR